MGFNLRGVLSWKYFRIYDITFHIPSIEYSIEYSTVCLYIKNFKATFVDCLLTEWHTHTGPVCEGIPQPVMVQVRGQSSVWRRSSIKTCSTPPWLDGGRVSLTGFDLSGASEEFLCSQSASLLQPCDVKWTQMASLPVPAIVHLTRYGPYGSSLSSLVSL